MKWDIQALGNTGALDQVNTQGSVDKWLTSEKGLPALEQLLPGQETIKQVNKGGMVKGCKKLRSDSGTVVPRSVDVGL